MQYLVIMGVLIAVAVILIIVIIVALLKGKQEDQEEYDEDEDGEEYEEETGEAEEKPRRKGKPSSEQGGHKQDEGLSVIGQDTKHQDEEEAQGENEESQVPGKKLWKIGLENLGNWQKSTFVFYENIGIGRGKNFPQFEKFMTIGDDPRISKLHCAIIQKDEKLYLKDMGSRNGTYLNGKHITQPVLLQRDDIIGVGETEIEIQSMMREKD